MTAEGETMVRKVALFSAAMALLIVPGQAQQATSIADLRTTAEASDFTSTSTYQNVVGFMRTAANASPDVFYTTYGTTHEGREMPMAVVGTGLADASAASVLGSNKLRVHIQGNIHAGEVEGKEAAQILLRELALGRHDDWLESMVLLITPIFNADGNERFSLNNRPRQNGPVNGMGTRPNAQGLNLNRDFMKLDTPEARAFVSLWNDYDPHVGLDLHTSDGSRHAYHLTYSPPLNPNTSDLILDVMKDEWFPFITEQVRENHGWHMFYYGNASGGARGRRGGGAQAAAPQEPPPPQAWRTFEHVPRFHNNYVGLRNRFALLSEAYAYATFEDRIKATYYFIEAALSFARANAERLKDLVAAADRESVVGRQHGTRAQIATGELVEILMGDVEDEVNPNNGAVMNRRLDVVRPVEMLDQMWFEPTATELVPSEFYVPASATTALELLRRHGIQMREVDGSVDGLERFAIASNTQDSGRGRGRRGRSGVPQGPRLFEGHSIRRLEGSWEAPTTAVFPAGAWVVPLDQPLGRLAFYLLAPTSDDGLLTWNAFDEILGDRNTYPVLRRR
jgi:hypothetical protein